MADEPLDKSLKRKAEESKDGVMVKNLKLEGSNEGQYTSFTQRSSGFVSWNNASTSQNLISNSLPNGCNEGQSSTQSSSEVESSASTSQNSISNSLPNDGVQQIKAASISEPLSTKSSEMSWIDLSRIGHSLSEIIEALSTPAVRINLHKKYNLREVFAEIWQTLFALPGYTTGSRLKLINNNLGEEILLKIARILKRGWEDERFFPVELAPPLLETCLFNRESIYEIKFQPNMFLEYIDPIDEKIIANGGGTVNEEILEVIQKYCPVNEVSLGDEVDSACIKVLHKIMYSDLINIHQVWLPELVGLLEFEKFKFIIKTQPTTPIFEEIDVLYTPPHTLWGTFFYKWSDEMIRFYFKLLKNENFNSCSFCKGVDVDAEHILHKCESTLHYRMLKECHNCVLKIIVQKMKKSLNSPYFSTSNDWKLTAMKQNLSTYWPEDLNMLDSQNLLPHIVVWTSHPVKMALVMDIAILWDWWFDINLYNSNYQAIEDLHYNKRNDYKSFCKILKEHDFETKFQYIEIGSRGTFSRGLYIMFEEICGMTHSEISKTMEKISKTIIEVAFNFQYGDD